MQPLCIFKYNLEHRNPKKDTAQFGELLGTTLKPQHEMDSVRFSTDQVLNLEKGWLLGVLERSVKSGTLWRRQ